MDATQATALVLAVSILSKLYMKFTSGVCRCNRSMEGKTVIVTGANTGIGLETARELARKKARVILACRSLQRGQEAAEDITRTTGNSNVKVSHLNLASLDSIRKFAKEVTSTEDRLDVLIHNAGMTPIPGRHLTDDGLELQFAVNHFGPFILTHLLMPLLRRSAPSRIIVVSSVTHWWARLDLENLNCEKYIKDPYWTYCSTKLANILFTKELSKRLHGTGVTANCLHPGGVRTAIARNARWFIKYLITPVLYLFFRDAKSGAQTSIHLAVSEEVQGISGQYFVDCKPASVSSTAQNKEIAEKLWNLSEEMTRIQPEEKIQSAENA